MNQTMSLNYYQQEAGTTAIYPERGTGSRTAINYCLVGMGGEAGEVLNKWKKILRGDKPLDLNARQAFAKELGGVLWYLARAANELDYSLEEVAAFNLAELASRSARGTIQGDGDDR
jgi:NTP pyrophosphatase (non-canonical NTP hydrolase)